jgi:predicted nucleotidyltransferase
MAEFAIEPQENIIKKVRQLLDVLALQGVRILAAYLYGSYALGNPHQDSDIDVAIVSPDLSNAHMDDWVRLNVPASHIDARMEVMGFRPEQFHDEHPLVWEIKTKGVQLL